MVLIFIFGLEFNFNSLLGRLNRSLTTEFFKIWGVELSLLSFGNRMTGMKASNF